MKNDKYIIVFLFSILLIVIMLVTTIFNIIKIAERLNSSNDKEVVQNVTISTNHIDNSLNQID